MTRVPYRKIPKTDLHCHLDGSLRWETVRELAPKAGVRLPVGAPESLRSWKADGGCRTLDSALEMFQYLVPLLRTRPALERASTELLEDCAADGIRYVEVRFAPALCVSRTFSAEDSVTAVLAGLEAGRKATGVESRVILCLLRGQTPRESRETVRNALRFAGRGVTGLDLAGTESLPSDPFAPYFEEALDSGLAATCHAGETGERGHLEAALSFGVSRIGHGTALAGRPDLLRVVRRRGICVEVSLSSNWATGAVDDIAEHPFLDYHRAGVPVALCTDDRGVFGIDLAGEYRRASRAGAAAAELAAMALAGARHAFLPAADKRALVARMASELRMLGLAESAGRRVAA